MPITDPTQRTPEYPTNLLHKQGFPKETVVVTTIEILSEQQTNVSATYNLAIAYIGEE